VAVILWTGWRTAQSSANQSLHAIPIYMGK